MEKQGQAHRPKVQYRVQLEKRIEINRSYKQKRNQAVALRILSYSLFGKKRYQNIYLSSSLNCLYFAIKIANVIHLRVPGLAMIVKFQNLDVIEYYSQEFEGKHYANKKYSRVVIKLTKNPSEEDKKQPGYNPGLDAADINQPLTEVMKNKNRSQRYNNNRNQYRDNKRDNRDNRYNRDNMENKTYNRNRKEGRNISINQDRRPQRKQYDQSYVKTQKRPQKKSYKNPSQQKKRYGEQNQDRQPQQNPPTKSEYQRGQTKTRGGSSNIGNRQEHRGERQPRVKNRNQDE